jgi:hypothetical protein
MNDLEFRTALEQWAVTGCAQLLGTIPDGSGICRVVDMPASRYSVAYVSAAEGSFKEGGERGNWYATHFQLARTEAKITGSCIYEYSKMNQATPVLDCHRLPAPIVNAIYDDKDLPVGLYEKSHIVIDVVRGLLPKGSWSGVYFPSRREPGGILLFDRNQVAVTTVYTGDQVPKPEEIG